jgi:hypothetical protein
MLNDMLYSFATYYYSRIELSNKSMDRCDIFYELMQAAAAAAAAAAVCVVLNADQVTPVGYSRCGT